MVFPCIIIALLFFELSHAFWTVACDPKYISEANLRLYEGKMFLQLKSGGGHGTPFGIFVFNKNTLGWTTLGMSVAGTEDSFQYNGQTFKTRDFF